MGSQSTYTCTQYGIQTPFISGGRSRGMYVYFETRSCNPCSDVRDYNLGEDWKDVPPPCAICSGKTAIWDKKCMSCSGDMDEGFSMAMYD